VRASARPRRRKSRCAVTRDVLDRLVATCGSERLVETRDIAILMVAFASGGRRRSEVAGLRVEQLQDEPPVPPILPTRIRPPCPAKTTVADDGSVLLVGPPVAAQKEWLERSNISKGPVFRAIDRWGGGSRPDAAVDQPDRQAPVRGGGSRSEGLFGAWTTGGLSDRGGATWRFVAGGDAAVPASVGPTAASDYNDAERSRGKAARFGV